MELTLARMLVDLGKFEDAEKVFIDGIRFREKFSEEEFPALRHELSHA